MRDDLGCSHGIIPCCDACGWARARAEVTRLQARYADLCTRRILTDAAALVDARCADHGLDPTLAGDAADALSALLADREG